MGLHWLVADIGRGLTAADAAMTAPGTAPMPALIDFDSARYLYLHGERADASPSAPSATSPRPDQGEHTASYRTADLAPVVLADDPTTTVGTGM
jgi:hypothetical protein